MKNGKFKIENIIVEHILDEYADTSFIGEYTDKLEAGVIIRNCSKFYEDCSDEEIEEAYENRPGRNEYIGFKPYAGGEQVGTKNYKEYGKQDYKRIEQLNKGNFCFIGIKAKANIYFEYKGYNQYQEITSGGLWGIESDSDKSYIEEVEKQELEDLKTQLENLNVDISNFHDPKILIGKKIVD